jgi:hypothetical protein
VQEVVHQRIDRDHAAADFNPALAASPSTQQQAGQGHAQNFVRETVIFYFDLRLRFRVLAPAAHIIADREKVGG